MIDDWLRHILFATMRWLHIVCTTLVVGGTLFYEFVLPIALEDLKKEQQLAAFGKARWMFKRVVWASAFLLLLSGSISVGRMWERYQQPEQQASMGWAVAHMALAIVALGIALLLTGRRRPPEHQVGWMRVNLAILVVVVLCANVTRHIRLTVLERREAQSRLRQVGSGMEEPHLPPDAQRPPTATGSTTATAPATAPATRPAGK